MVLMHTTGDHMVPIRQMLLYYLKVFKSGSRNVIPIPITRYGHCTFTGGEIQAGMSLLVYKVTGRYPTGGGLRFDLQQAEHELSRLR
jgi:hypothetical protein